VKHDAGGHVIHALQPKLLLAAAICLASCAAWGDEVRVMISGAFRPVYFILAPEFERTTGHKLVTITGASMGTAPTAVPARLRRQEPADVVILARSSLDALASDRLVVRGSELDLVRSPIALAIRAGAAVPDISTEEGLNRPLSVRPRSPIPRVRAASTWRRSSSTDWVSVSR
jgi:molybdate transport system substrate-binding protein